MGMTIIPIYRASAYHDLAGSELASRLFSARPPGLEAPSTYARHRTPPPFLDVIMWAHMSASVLWASLLSAAGQARQARDTAQVEQHESNAGKVWAAVLAGNAGAMEYLQEEAGHARISLGAGAGAGARYRPARWEDAHPWVSGSFPQFASSAGGPRLHVHNLIVNSVQAKRTGEWGVLDSSTLADAQVAAAAIGRRVIQEALGRDLGVTWVRGADGRGWEIAGISQDVIDLLASYSLEDGDQGRPGLPAEEAPTPAPAAEPMSLRDELQKMGWFE